MGGSREGGRWLWRGERREETYRSPALASRAAGAAKFSSLFFAFVVEPMTAADFDFFARLAWMSPSIRLTTSTGSSHPPSRWRHGWCKVELCGAARKALVLESRARFRSSINMTSYDCFVESPNFCCALPSLTPGSVRGRQRLRYRGWDTPSWLMR